MFLTSSAFAAKDHENLTHYIHQMKTLQGQFIQTDSNGGSATGRFWIKRPTKNQKFGQIKIDYNDPVPILLITDDNSLVYFDKELNQVTYLGIEDSPLDILLGNKPVPANWVKKTHDEEQYWHIMLQKPETAEKIALSFNKKNKRLVQWRITDAKGVQTTVRLLSVKAGLKISDQVFSFNRPKKGPYNPLLDD